MRGRMRLLSTLAVLATLASACATTIAGSPVPGTASDTDDAAVALLDTGSYPITQNRIYGNAGSNVYLQGMLEGQRLAEYVVGPWRIDASLLDRGGVLDMLKSAPIPDAASLSKQFVLADPLPEVAATHGFITGFSTFRVSTRTTATWALLNVVMRFPDSAAASAAAQEMADRAPAPGADPGSPIALDKSPDAHAKTYEIDCAVAVSSFTPHGPYVLHQFAQAPHMGDMSADNLVNFALDEQSKSIDRFTPTESARLPELPKDPTGQLFALALWGPDNAAPAIVGAYPAQSWLHFEDNPVAAQALFDNTGVDAVAQTLSTVYRTRDQANAARFVDSYAETTAQTPYVVPLTDIPGLPQAKCFARTQGYAEPAVATSVRRILWQFKCVAWADRYAFTTFSNDERDVKQQAAAQYRILAGK
jgi:hypothetical protein